MRKLAFLFVLAAGCGRGGDDINPSINGVSPPDVFLARTMSVQVSGYGTSWRAANPPQVTVDGAGVTVANVTVASPTALFADVTVDPDAATGIRTLRVDGLAFDGLEIAAPAFVEQILGNDAQGSIFVLRIANRDPFHPFDETVDGFGTPENIFVQGPGGGTAVGLQVVHAMSMDVVVFADVTATGSSTNTVTISSGPFGNVDLFPIPNAFTLAPRTALPFTGGSVTGTITAPLESRLYSIAATEAAPRFIDLGVTATGVGAQPLVALFGQSGSFTDFTFGEQAGTVLLPATTRYVLYVDFSMMSNYDFTIVKADYPTVEVTESEANDTAGTADDLAFIVVEAGYAHGTLASAGDADWYKLQMTAGRRVHARTYPGDIDTDTVLDVFRADGITLLGTSPDNGYHEDFRSLPVPATETVFVRVTASSFSFSGTAYDLVITSEL